MRYQFIITAGAQEDMQACRHKDRFAATSIALFLREIETDDVACEALIDTSVCYDDGIESVKLFAFMQDRRINAYTVRLIEVGAWRIISGVDHRGKRVGVFGVMPRDFNYDESPEYCQRVIGEYDEHNFPRI